MQTENVRQPNEISLADIFTGYKKVIANIRQRWRLILLCVMVAAVMGLCYSIFVKPKYTAVCTFVLDDNDNGMLSQYAGLASLAGLELNSGGGIFKGDNILELYKSRSMIERALLSEGQFNGQKLKLIERYITFNELRERWKNHDDINSIDFNGDPLKFNRKQDSLITDIAETFNKKNLDVAKPDKKLSVIKVTFTSKDELFAKEFTDKLVENVNSFYIQTKIKKTAQNVTVLQRQADSVKATLNTAIYGAASALDAAPNANPALLSLRVPSQKKQVDVQTNTAVYAEIVKNLEIAKVSLLQQTPLIQFIDQPVLPLTKDHVGVVKGIIIGAFLGLFLTVAFLFMQMLVRSVIKNTL